MSIFQLAEPAAPSFEAMIAQCTKLRLAEQQAMIAEAEALLADFMARRRPAFALQSYTYDEGPSMPKGRRKMEDIGDFIRRTQTAELRAATKNIFAPVSLAYDHMTETRRRLGMAKKDGPSTAASIASIEDMRAHIASHWSA